MFTLVLSDDEAEALFCHLRGYVEAHTDTGYDPPYNGEPELAQIAERLGENQW